MNEGYRASCWLNFCCRQPCSDGRANNQVQHGNKCHRDAADYLQRAARHSLLPKLMLSRPALLVTVAIEVALKDKMW